MLQICVRSASSALLLYNTMVTHLEFFFHLNSYTFESELPRIAYLLPSYIVKLTVPHLDIEGLMQYFIFGFTEQSPALGSILLVRLFADLGL